MWCIKHPMDAAASHIMRSAHRARPRSRPARRRGLTGSRARIRTSVERTKTACPAWLDDPGMLPATLQAARPAGVSTAVPPGSLVAGFPDPPGLILMGALRRLSRLLVMVVAEGVPHVDE